MTQYKTREIELKAAFGRAKLPPAAHTILYNLLYRRTEFGSAVVDWQPASNAAWAASLGIPERTLQRGVQTLVELGWVKRTEHPGKSSTYQVQVGRSAPEKKAALSAAERQRNCRARRKARQENVTQVRQENVTGGPEGTPLERDTCHEKWRDSHATIRHETAGQSPAVQKGINEGEGVTEPPANPLTVAIAGHIYPAVICSLCQVPVRADVARDGCHPGCLARHQALGRLP